jgi:uncharacterized protein YecT (DUF1311 family)
VGNLKFNTFTQNYNGFLSWSIEIPASAYCQTVMANFKTKTMKQIKLIFLFIVIARLGFSQQAISDKDLEIYKQEIVAESQKLKQELLQKDNPYDIDKQIVVNFQIDTFLIERLQAKIESIDCSTAGSTQSLYDMEIGYDKLLNKYYEMLLKKLNDQDKELLRKSQRNWILYRDSDREFNKEVAKDEYTGGGSMHLPFVAYHYADITKKRVFELFYYLTRISE